MELKIPDLRLIHEEFLKVLKEKDEYFNTMTYQPDFKMYMFPQKWPEPYFDRKTKYTTVVTDEWTGWCGVFFEEKLAYVILKPNKHFYEDLDHNQMESVSRQEKYTGQGEFFYGNWVDTERRDNYRRLNNRI